MGLGNSTDSLSVIPSDILGKILCSVTLVDLHTMMRVSKINKSKTEALLDVVSNWCVKNLLLDIAACRDKYRDYSKLTDKTADRAAISAALTRSHDSKCCFVMSTILNRPSFQFDSDVMKLLMDLASDGDPVSDTLTIQLCCRAIRAPVETHAVYRFILLTPYFKLSWCSIQYLPSDLATKLKTKLINMFGAEYGCNTAARNEPAISGGKTSGNTFFNSQYVVLVQSLIVMLLAFGDESKLTEFFLIVKKLYEYVSANFAGIKSWYDTPYSELLIIRQKELELLHICSNFVIMCKYTSVPSNGRELGISSPIYISLDRIIQTYSLVYPLYLKVCLQILSDSKAPNIYAYHNTHTFMVANYRSELNKLSIDTQTK
jgi:hypothetical protein